MRRISGNSETPDSSSNTIQARVFTAPFDAWPLVRDPAGDLGFVPLHRPTLRPLRTPSQPAGQQAPDRGLWQRHSRHPLDDQADPLQGSQNSREGRDRRARWDRCTAGSTGAVDTARSANGIGSTDSRQMVHVMREAIHGEWSLVAVSSVKDAAQGVLRAE